jgi:hypothetical protein
MPIRPENRSRYPADWPQISAAIRDRAGDRCEACGVENGAPDNLRAWCQRCHNAYDAPMRRAGIAARARAARAAGDLFQGAGQ